MTINEKIVDVIHGTQTRGSRMVGTDESTELWPTLLPQSWI